MKYHSTNEIRDFGIYLIMLGSTWLIGKFILTSNVHWLIQFLVIMLMTALSYLIYPKIEQISQELDQEPRPCKFSLSRWYIIFCVIMGFTLSTFSQQELMELGFNFPETQAKRMSYYLWLKMIFITLGVLHLPRFIRYDDHKCSSQ